MLGHSQDEHKIVVPKIIMIKNNYSKTFLNYVGKASKRYKFEYFTSSKPIFLLYPSPYLAPQKLEFIKEIKDSFNKTGKTV